ncbi:hypothetical protein ACFU7Z_38415 [Kitasatospora sp. NPDC057518]|uniref:hypothetical protein n=1 Tax=Kitasatospora sp. NPDC057518 TaxID=3346155 RepID=UPI0036CB5BC9
MLRYRLGSTMQIKRTSALLAAVVAAGLGLTACNSDGSSTAAPSTAASTPAAAAPTTPAAASSAPATGAPAATPSAPAAGGTAPATAVQNGKTRPADLPADIPLPTGKITTVNGATGGYLITCEATDGDLAAYQAALKAAGFEVSPVGDGSVLAEKGESNLLITSSSTTITVTYAKI